MIEKVVKVTTGDRNAGTLYLPEEKASRCTTIIYCHGWRASRDLPNLMTKFIEATSGCNIAVVAFDFFGCGDTGGDYDDMTYGRWTRNLGDIVSWVREQPWAVNDRVGCIGISSGTTPALRLAQIDMNLAFVVSVATCLGLFIGMPNGPAKVMFDHFDELQNGEKAPIFKNRFPMSFFRDFLSEQPAYGMADTNCPVFFLQGMDDNPWRRTDAWLGYLLLQRNNLPVRYEEIPEGGHGLGKEAIATEAAAKIRAWMESLGFIEPVV